MFDHSRGIVVLQVQPYEPSNDEINDWLEQLIPIMQFFTVKRIDYNHWRLDCENSEAYFTLDIFDQGQWITYGIVLVPDVEGQDCGEFYRSLLDINAYLNGAHIGIANDQVILTREEPKGGLVLVSLAESLLIINNALSVYLSPSNSTIR